AYERLERLGSMAEAALGDALAATGVPGCVNRVGSLLTLFLRADRVANYADTQRADPARFADFFRRMLAEGIYLPPSQFEAMFLSLAHSEADVEALRGGCRRGSRGSVM